MSAVLLRNKSLLKKSVIAMVIGGMTMGYMAASPSAFAASQPTKWTIDNSKTVVNFEVRYLKAFRLNGKFTDAKGNIFFDEKSPQDTTVNFTVQTESVDTSMSARDAFLRRKELLDTEKHPTMNFVSHSVQLDTPRSGKVHGSFTALGITKPLTVKVTLTEASSAQPRLNFHATGVVNRQDYGSTALPNMIGNTIPITITGQLVPAK